MRIPNWKLMNYELLFSLSNLLVMPFWLLMIFVPKWSWTRKIIDSPLIIVPPALLYLFLVIPSIGGLLGSLANPSLSDIAGTIGTEYGATVAWAHFLAFDLFVGRWAYLDSRERNINVFVMAPVLFFTLMLGPVGFLSYLAIRALYNRR